MTRSYDEHDGKFWLNFVSLCSVLALSEVARGIVTPVLPLYTTALNGSPFMLSVVVSAFSIGRLIASMIYGVLSDRMSIRLILCSALVITIIGHVLYIVAEYTTTANNAALVVLVIGRACSGSGTSILSAARAFTAKYTAPHERTFFFSTLGIVQFIGFAGTPVLGGIYVHMNLGAGWIINTYTFGTYLVMILDTILLFVIWFGLNDDPVTAPSTTPAVTSSSDQLSLTDDEELLKDRSNMSDFVSISMQNTSDMHEMSQPARQRSQSMSLPVLSEHSVRQRRHSAPAVFHTDDADVVVVESTMSVVQYSAIAAILLVVLNGASRGCLAVAETYGADLYYIVQFGEGYTRDEVSTINEAWFYTGLGAIGVIIFLFMHKLTLLFGEVTLLISGFCFMAIGFFSVVGADVSFGTLIFGMFMLYSLSTPVNNTLCASMLSKECSPESAGLMMGWLTAAGSLGRIVFPLMSGAFYAAYGTSGAMLFPAIVAILSAISIIVVLKTYVNWLDAWRNLEQTVMQRVYGRQLVSTEDDDINDWQSADDVFEKQQQHMSDFGSHEMVQMVKHLPTRWVRLQIDDSSKS